MSDTDKALLLLIAGLIPLYVLLWFTIRWFAIARFNQRRLHGNIESLKARARLGVRDTQGQSTARDREVSESIQNLVNSAEDAIKVGFFYFLTWTGRREFQAWLCVHEAERQLVDKMSKDEARARLESAQKELKAIGDADAKAMAKDAKALLVKDSNAVAYLPGEFNIVITEAGVPNASARKFVAELKPFDPPGLEQVKATLKESLRLIHTSTEERFVALLSLHNKTSWVLALGLAGVAILSLLGNPLFLFFGALGGLFSAMARTRASGDLALTQSNVVRWIRLFISPLLGAIAGFVGLQLISLLASLNLLGEPLQNLPIAITPPIALIATPSPSISPTVAKTPVPTTVASDAIRSPQLILVGAPNPNEVVSGTMNLAAVGENVQLIIQPSESPTANPQAYGWALALAFILGFSERLFTTYLGKLDPPGEGEAKSTAT